MSELRWTLLILGVVFIAALSWWERRRPRQAFAPHLREGREAEARGAERPDTASGLCETRTGEGGSGVGKRAPPPGAATGMGLIREPWIGDTELSDSVLSDAALAPEHSGGRGVSARFGPSAPGPLEDLPTLVIPDADERLSLQAAWDAEPPEPRLIDPDASVTVETLPPQEAADPQAPPPEEPSQPAVASGPREEIAGAEGVGCVRVMEPVVPCGDGVVSAEPIVDWPPDESRRIVALRLIAPQSERFPGRALRLALAAEGFLLGKYSIFHKPDEANRAVLSVASLTSPGAFDLTTMDSQRYAGLSLFAVLPGPRAPSQAFEELLATARNLNERLQGALQDERGGPLTPLRVASLRESLRAEAVPVAAAAAHET